MADTFFGGQVDSCNLVGTEEDAVVSVVGQGPNGDALAPEGLGHLPQPILEADIVLRGGDRAHDLVLVVVHVRKAVGHRASAWPIAAGRHLLVKRLVRPFKIVDHAPGVEGTLRFGEIAKASERKHFGVERAVETLVLAAALRVIWPAVQNSDTELEQPTPSRVQRCPHESPHGPPLSTKKASGSP